MVDDNEYEELNKSKWYAVKTPRGNYYAFKSVGMGTHISMASEVMHVIVDGLVIDHINHNTLDNRHCNLRHCTQQQNRWNSRKSINNTSGYKGVQWLDGGLDYFGIDGTWIATITVDGTLKYLGYYDDKELAAKAYNDAAIKYFGEYACLNELKALTL